MAKICQRELAVYALIDIINLGGYNNIVLKKTLSKNNSLESVEKAFITEVVNGTLRNLIYIDYVINTFSKTPTEKMKPLIVNILRTGVYQIIFMDKTPDSAACNEAVNIAKAKGFKNLAPFINGVLRNISRSKNDIKLPNKIENPVLFLSVAYSLPKWIIEYWLNEMNIETVEQICKNNNISPKITVCINTLKINDKQMLIDLLSKEGIKAEKAQFNENALYLSNTSDLALSESFNKGLFHVMDEASMLAVDVMDVKPNKKVMDICAAPGGKSFYCSYIMKNTGELFSYDIHQHKIDIMEQSINRLGIEIINTEVKDSLIFNSDKENTVDYLLIDAPCSGLGLLRKKPDIKYTKTLNDIKDLSALQKDILKSNWKYLKIGGVLVYSTCTISKQENIDNIKWFISNYSFELETIENYLPKGLQSPTAKDGYIQLLPIEKNIDGFFIAKLRRKG